MTEHFYAAGENLAIAFNLQPVKDEEATRAAGRLVCRDVEYITKVVPGDRNSRVHRPLREQDRRLYGKQYEDWKSGRAAVVDGTPLEAWAACSRSQVEELRYKHVRTVEQMAAMSEATAQAMGLGYLELRERAKDFVAQAKGEAPLSKLRAEHSELKAQLEATREQLEEALRTIREIRSQGEGGGEPAPRYQEEAPQAPSQERPGRTRRQQNQ
jgi:hypothetical protein